ncbi:hypothetical protein [Pseudonocardia sp. NPDC049154]|uniref:hypothetical protein n=1 Tax=Pseudonocardia sp. NPDC049154 TaxID=3155501 RepID=UPI0033E4A2BC
MSRNRQAASAPLVAGLDWAEAARGASSGLSVLVVGGLVQPLVGVLTPVLGAVWLIVVAVAAFGVAGRRIGTATAPYRQGAVCAVLAYLFVLPLVVYANQGLDVAQAAGTTVTAVVVGGLVGHLRGRSAVRAHARTRPNTT